MEDALDAVSHTDRHHRRGHTDPLGLLDRLGGRLPDPALLLHLLGQIRDPDLSGPAAVECRLDRRADVVGVDVAVPQPVAPHDHDRVADPGPDVAERRDRLVRRVQEVHHLVPQVGHVAVVLVDGGLELARLGSGLGRDDPLSLSGLRDRTAVRDVEQGVEQQDEAHTAGVDHAVLGEDRKELGCAIHAAWAPSRAASRTSTKDAPPSAAAAAASDASYDGEDRALDGVAHGLVGGRARRDQG